MPQILRLGTRGSRLAMVQAEMVKAALQSRTGVECVLVPVKTSGDRIQDRLLADAGGKGLFVKELEDALLSEAIDLAVHSMKDVPTAMPAGTEIAAILPREDPRDAFVSNKAKSFADLAAGAQIGTSSARRQAQVRRARPDVECTLLRGNVDTRLAKLDAGKYDAMILAVAGLKRLGLENRITAPLDGDRWLPALAQGAIGIEIRETDTHAREIVAQLNDKPTELAITCERAFQDTLDGSCRTSMGGLATLSGKVLSFRGEVLAPDGSEWADVAMQTTLDHGARPEAEALGRNAGEQVKPRASKWLQV